MKSLLKDFGASVSELRRRDEGISLRSIRKDMLPYMLAYAVELMLYAVRQVYLPVNETLFGLPGKTVIYVAHMAASLIVMLLWSERFRKLVVVSVAVMAAGFAAFVFVPRGTEAYVWSGVAAMAGLGGAVTCARCGFAFASNNTERMVGMLLMTVSVALIYLLDTFNVTNPAAAKGLPLALTALLAVCLLKFKEGDLEAKEVSGAEDAKGLYCALAFMIVYFGIDGYLYKFADAAGTAGSVLFSAGMIVSAAAFFAVPAVLKKNVWNLWTQVFLLSAAAAALAVLGPRIGSDLPCQLVSGLATLGWPLSLYMLACAQRRFASYRLLKRCTVIFVILSPLTTVTDDVINSYWPERIPGVALVYILVMLILFLLTVPYTYRHLFSVGWIGDLSRDDMKRIYEKTGEGDMFAGYDLTPRQKEVAALLLAAKTRRQISGELGLSESTVKMHASELYRKLNINSRVELFRLFGVSDAEEKTE